MTAGGTESCRVFAIQRFCVHDGPGIRTTVFLAGCPLRCIWCQNPEGFDDGAAAELTPQEILAEVLRDRPYYDASGGGLTVSGGEPLLRPMPARALLDEAKSHGLHTCLQTSGAAPATHLTALLGSVDLFQFDLKHMDPVRHRALTGAGTARIHRNAAWLRERGANVQFRMPLLPGVNDTTENLDRVAGFLLELDSRELRLVPYHRLYLDKYRALGLPSRAEGIESPSEGHMQHVAREFLCRGITVAIDG